MDRKEQPKPSIFYYYGGQSPVNLASIRRNIAKRVGVHPNSEFFAQFGNEPHTFYYSFDGLNRLDHLKKNEAIVGYIVQMGEEIKPSECVEFSRLKDLQGVEIETRIGEKVRVLCTDAKNSKPVVAAITNENREERIFCYTNDGKLNPDTGHSGVFYDLVCYENIPPQEVFIKPTEGYPSVFNPIKSFVLQTLQNVLNSDNGDVAKKLNAVECLHNETKLSLRICSNFIQKVIDDGRIVVYDKNGAFVREYVIDF